MISDLKSILKFASVQEKARHGAPFGKPLKKTLDWFLKRAKAYGLKTENMDGYCGWCEYGEGKEILGILCHLDVVPSEAYGLTWQDGYLCGRGVADNKGPAIVFLHILKRLKEEGYKAGHRIRLIVGCNEESGSGCIAHYMQNAEIPALSIVPDSDFPAVNSEKGILHLELSLPVSKRFQNEIASLSFGTSPNVVPETASAVFKSGRILKTKGVAGHAMSPEKAVNASRALFEALQEYDECKAISEALCHFDASGLKIACGDEESGKLTMNLGCGNYDGTAGLLHLILDFRMPLCINQDTVACALQNAFPNATVTRRRFSKNLYYNPDSLLIQTLLTVYRSVTGDFSPPVQTGGGTYARSLPNAVAFGPTFPGEDYLIHNDSEKIPAGTLQKWFDIYEKAVKELDKLTF